MGIFDGLKKKDRQKEAVNYEIDPQRTGELYKQIADKVSDMIPDQWSDIYFYGEVLDDSTMAFFFYKQAQNGALLYCHYIPAVYKVSKDVYNTKLQELFKIIRELRDEHKNNGRAVWTNFTMKLDSTGKFNLKYNYDDVLDGRFSISERNEIWQYEVLGRIPVEDKMRKKLQEYLGDKVRLPEKNKFAGQKINSAICPVCGKSGLNKRENTLYRCEQCMTRVYTDPHDVVMYIYDQELHDALYRSMQLSAKGDYSNALKELTPYENKAWDNLGFVYQLGLAYRRAGYEDMAANWFFKCKYIKLDYVMAYHSIGLIDFQRRNFKKALNEYEYSVKFLEADPDAYSIDEQRTFYALYGGSLAGCGRKEEGEAMIRKAEAMGYGNGNRIREIAGLPV